MSHWGVAEWGGVDVAGRVTDGQPLAVASRLELGAAVTDLIPG